MNMWTNRLIANCGTGKFVENLYIKKCSFGPTIINAKKTIRRDVLYTGKNIENNAFY